MPSSSLPFLPKTGLHAPLMGSLYLIVHPLKFFSYSVDINCLRICVPSRPELLGRKELVLVIVVSAVLSTVHDT